jgi:hydroxymethylpyrimidine/phosphomethylpyrimidine kinase
MKHQILTIGGFDPSAGAGVLADVKTFEQHKVYGMAVNTANTVQSDDEFLSVNWVEESVALAQLEVLCDKYQFGYVKFGLVPSLDFVLKVIGDWKGKKPQFLWDPILKISAGYDLAHQLKRFDEVLGEIDIVTPNWNEIKQIGGDGDVMKIAEKWSEQCLVYLKGGHHDQESKVGKDYLFEKGKLKYIFNNKAKRPSEKHGSGCILSSSFISNLAKGYPLKKAGLRTKDYMGRILDSNESLLAVHKT